MRGPCDQAARDTVRRRPGYTLLELLIASVLVATLMAAAWGMMSMYGDFLMAGRSQATEQQLARSLMDLLADDLRAVTVQTQSSTAPRATRSQNLPVASTQEMRPSEDDDDRLSAPINADAGDGGIEFRLPEFALQGSSNELTLLMTRALFDLDSMPSPPGEEDLTLMADEIGGTASSSPEDLLFGQGLPARPRAGGWTQVIYRFVAPEPVVTEDVQLSPGLHRFEIPVEYLGLLSQTGALGLEDTADPLSGSGDGARDVTTVLAMLRDLGITNIKHEAIPEVVSCRWEFLDESNWWPTWDSGQEGRLPGAVRLRLKLLSETEQGELMKALGVGTETDAAAEVEEVDFYPANDAATDPYKAFHPRVYERIVLLDSVRRPPPKEPSENGNAFSAFSPSTSLPGGAP